MRKQRVTFVKAFFFVYTLIVTSLILGGTSWAQSSGGDPSQEAPAARDLACQDIKSCKAEVCEAVKSCNATPTAPAVKWHTKYVCDTESGATPRKGRPGCQCASGKPVNIHGPVPARPSKTVEGVKHHYFNQLVMCAPSTTDLDAFKADAERRHAAFLADSEKRFTDLWKEVVANRIRSIRNESELARQAEQAFQLHQALVEYTENQWKYVEGLALRHGWYASAGARMMRMPQSTVAGPTVGIGLRGRVTQDDSVGFDVSTRLGWSPSSFNKGTYNRGRESGSVAFYDVTAQLTFGVSEDNRTRLRIGPSAYQSWRVFGNNPRHAIGVGAEGGLDIPMGERGQLRPHVTVGRAWVGNGAGLSGGGGVEASFVF